MTGCFAHPAAAQRVGLVVRALKHVGAEVSVAPLEPEISNQSSGLAEVSKPRSPVTRSITARVVGRVKAAAAGTKLLAEAVRAGTDAIFNYSESWAYSIPVWRIARQNKTRVIQDCVEWYQPICFDGSRFHPTLVDQRRKRDLLPSRVSGVTVITSKLKALYAERGVPTFWLPPLFDRDEFESSETSALPRGLSDALEIVVATSGKPADGNQLVRPILEMARQQGVRFRLTVIGSVELFQERQFIGEESNNGDYRITRFRNLARGAYLQLLRNADVFILPRQPGLYSEAAFPNRIPEFMASGGVTITTAVGDIPSYIENGISGFLCQPGDVSGFASTLGWIASNRNKASAIGENARTAASSKFDYRVHADRLLGFVTGDYSNVLSDSVDPQNV